MSHLHRLLWIGYAANAVLGVATPLARAAFGRNAELWPVAASILLTHLWAYALHRKQYTWHRALTMGIAGLVSGAAIGMLLANGADPKPGFPFVLIIFTLFGVLLTRLFVKEMRMEAVARAEQAEWNKRFEKMSDKERLEEFQRFNREAEALLAAYDRRARFLWPLVALGVTLIAFGVWVRFFAR